ncbi:unnamed protein product [Rotaria sp. Silwood1]|nr:unnamed protein product [Rotaria sp. Silwood1]CAF4626013.1 unnamed protein product [Rotaria sp. Silwood1]
MPNYQLLCIFKNLPKPELMMGIKAAATCILDHNGVIKSFENLGLRRLPIRLIGNDAQIYREGHYIFINFISGTTKTYEMMAALKREGDILRRVISNDDKVNEKHECHCDKYGYFVTDIVDYTKPLTLPNSKDNSKLSGVLLNVFTPEECQQWIQMTEECGYCPVLLNLGKQQVLMIDSVTMTQIIFERIKVCLPNVFKNHQLTGFIQRLHFLRYDPGQKFEKHFRMVLVFEHDLLYEGSPLRQGRKYTVRTDVMYKSLMSKTFSNQDS